VGAKMKEALENKGFEHTCSRNGNQSLKKRKSVFDNLNHAGAEGESNVDIPRRDL